MNLSEQIDTSRNQSMVGMDIPWLLEQWVQRTPDKPFMIWEPFTGETAVWSFLELQLASKSVASGLHTQGVRQGDFVIIHLDNSPEFIISWFACAMLGAVAVSTNTRSVARDMTYFAEHTRAVCAITQPKFASLITESCPDLRFLWVTDNDTGEPTSPPSGVQARAFSELLDHEATLPARAVAHEIPLSIQFTSGTTSRPKAVLWTHANGLWAGKISASHFRLRVDDITLVYLPLFHTNAQGYSMLSTLWSGGAIVLQPRFSSSRFWDICLKHRITWSSMIPFAFKALASQPVPVHQMRFWGIGARLPVIEQQFGVQTLGYWGMTETLTQGIFADLDQPGPAGSMGRVAPEYEIQVRKPTGGLAGPDELGILHIRGVRGVTLFKEYYGNAEATDSAFDENGWFDTGDIIRMDNDGHLFFSDRDKDMLKVGAENVAASEIESVILQTGWIDECAVVAQKHHMLDEVPVVFVIANPNAPDDLEASIIVHCREQLADFKVVRAVHIVDELPRSTLEKIAKNELRKRLAPITD